MATFASSSGGNGVLTERPCRARSPSGGVWSLAVARAAGAARSPSAGSGALFSLRGLLFRGLCLAEVLLLLAAVMLTHPRLDLRARQHSARLRDGLLAVQPLGLDPIEPRRLDR